MYIWLIRSSFANAHSQRDVGEIRVWDPDPPFLPTRSHDRDHVKVGVQLGVFNADISICCIPKRHRGNCNVVLIPLGASTPIQNRKLLCHFQTPPDVRHGCPKIWPNISRSLPIYTYKLNKIYTFKTKTKMYKIVSLQCHSSIKITYPHMWKTLWITFTHIQILYKVIHNHTILLQ